MTEGILAILFLLVSLTSAVIQLAALRALTRWNADTGRQRRMHDAMVRTACCRVLAAGIYVAVGIVTLLARQALPVLALVVFSFVQILWQANAFADVRLRRDLSAHDDKGA